MPTDDENPGPQITSRNGYFVLHASATWTGAEAELNGVMEDLSTGEKQVFASAADVSRLISAWASRELNQADASGSKVRTNHPQLESSP